MSPHLSTLSLLRGESAQHLPDVPPQLRVDRSCSHRSSLCLPAPQEGRRSVGGEPTVFYMPHCGTALYNNLLWSNWSVDALAKVLIIGNSFRGLEER